MSIQQLVRPEILALQPYVSARMQSASAVVALDANECPWSLFGDPDWTLNRYPDPQPQALVELLAVRYGVPEKLLLVTRGSDEGIDLLVRAFCRPGQITADNGRNKGVRNALWKTFTRQRIMVLWVSVDKEGQATLIKANKVACPPLIPPL